MCAFEEETSRMIAIFCSLENLECLPTLVGVRYTVENAVVAAVAGELVRGRCAATVNVLLSLGEIG